MKALLHSALYQKAIEEIKEKTNIGVDINYYDALVTFDNDRMLKVGIALIRYYRGSWRF